MDKWTQLADEGALKKTMQSLKINGIDATIVETGADAKAKVLEMIPKHAEVMTMSSVTLETIGLVDIINFSGDFCQRSVRILVIV